MFDHLNAINWTKENIIRKESDIDGAQKGYPAFPILRSLSYHPDSILIANELNTRGLEQFGVTPVMHFEFLLDMVSKKKRYGKWAKTTKEENIDLIVEFGEMSYVKAAEIVEFIPKDRLDYLRELKRQKDK